MVYPNLLRLLDCQQVWKWSPVGSSEYADIIGFVIARFLSSERYSPPIQSKSAPNHQWAIPPRTSFIPFCSVWERENTTPCDWPFRRTILRGPMPLMSILQAWVANVPFRCCPPNRKNRSFTPILYPYPVLLVFLHAVWWFQYFHSIRLSITRHFRSK